MKEGFPADATVSFATGLPTSMPTPEAGATLSRWLVAEGTGEANRATAVSGAAAYELQRVIGRGGMGEVWEALQVSLGRVVAVKRIRGEGAADEAQRAAFRREAAFSAILEHPNIVPVHDLGEDAGGGLLLAMKRVHGTPWNRMLEHDLRQLPGEELLAKHIPILAATTQAVAFAHSKGIVHRDIKPAQVMVGEFGEVLLMDWGLAFFHREAPAPEQVHAAVSRLGLTTRETAANPSGTPALMAPEQTRPDSGALGPWTDVYLLGGTLYFILTGTYPHHAATAAAAFELASAGTVQPPRERASDREVPAELEALCIAALQQDPERRPASAAEFHAALTDWMTGAGKRREALALLDGVEERLRGEPRDYRTLGECIETLERAQSLWPGQARTAALRDRALALYARAAVANGDLVLARVQQERIGEGALRGALDVQIGAAERSVARQRRTRRLAIAATVLSLVVIVAGGMWSRRAIERNLARALEAERQSRERAVQAIDARGRAEDLIRFMLTEFQGSLAPLGKIELLRKPAEKALEFYGSTADTQLSTLERTRKAQTLSILAPIQKDLGSLEESLRSLDHAQRLVEGLLAERPEDPTALGLAADIHLNRSTVLLFRGRAAEAREETQRAVAMGERRAAVLSNDTDARGDILYAKLGLFDALLVEGRAGESEAESVARALAQESETLAQSGGDARRIGTLRAQTWGRLAVALETAGRHADSVAARERERRAMLDIVALDPADRTAGVNAASAQASLARAQFAAGQREEALRSFRAAMTQLESFVQSDPANTAWARVYGINGAWLAHLLLEARAFEEARAVSERLVAMFDRMVAMEPSNADWKQGLTSALDTERAALAALGDWEAAAAQALRAQQTFDALRRDAPTQSSFAHEAALRGVSAAMLLVKAEEYAEAAALLHDARQRLLETSATIPIAIEHGRQATRDYARTLEALGRHDDAAEEWLALAEEGAPMKSVYADRTSTFTLQAVKDRVEASRALFLSGREEEAFAHAAIAHFAFIKSDALEPGNREQTSATMLRMAVYGAGANTLQDSPWGGPDYPGLLGAISDEPARMKPAQRDLAIRESKRRNIATVEELKAELPPETYHAWRALLWLSTGDYPQAKEAAAAMEAALEGGTINPDVHLVRRFIPLADFPPEPYPGWYPR